MAILEVLKYPDPRLSRIAQPVENINGDIVRLVNDLLETCTRRLVSDWQPIKSGRSIASLSWTSIMRIPQKNVYKLINPTIVRSEGEILWKKVA